ncbi:hypothetical protein P691DRAFT_809034 [Macrolepiota fuliginosa MF-IS2]|uniref:Uncharacterized protein n=1 Tax=Macrolepiota fuliginosa MF-IS2 TaxID=1400762 RepID=A0A9P5XGK0_9AGAR|nr:hypothetical protein P691DRAFT_809034 [Macrolepiota fuliginosa MF-IS2]
MINDAEKLMYEFNQLIDPDEWPEVASIYPEQYPSHIFNAYALLTCAIYLRKSTMNSSVSMFSSTQNAAMMALGQVINWPITTPEIASALSMRSSQERTLLSGANDLVCACMRAKALLDELPNRSGNELLNLPSSVEEEEVKYAELKVILRSVEKVAANYDRECLLVEDQQPKAVQLPGVAQTLHRISCISSNKSIFASPIKGLLLRWTNDPRNPGSLLEGFDFGYPISLSCIY